MDTQEVIRDYLAHNYHHLFSDNNDYKGSQLRLHLQYPLVGLQFFRSGPRQFTGAREN